MAQIGLGGGSITVYRASPFQQRGAGVGGFLKGLFRASLPLLKRGAHAVSRELLSQGVNLLDDIDHDVPVREAFHQRLSQAQNNLKRKAIDTVFRGKGYKTKKRKRAIQSKRGSRKRKTSKRRKKSRKIVAVRKLKKSKGRRRKRITRKNFADIFG